MTRFEKIKSMDIDKLADYFWNMICKTFTKCPFPDYSCHDCAKH